MSVKPTLTPLPDADDPFWELDEAAAIELLHAQLTEAKALLQWQGETIEAARAFCLVISSLNAKGDKALFTLNDDAGGDVSNATLNHRFVDLAALLNRGSTRPVPPKLAIGTVH